MPLKDNLISFLNQYGLQIAGAFITLAIGYFAAHWVGKVLGGWLEKRELEPPVRILLVRVVRLLIFGLAVMMAMTRFGFDIIPLIAGLSVAGVGVGLAAQGVLSNLIAGLTIIFTKPYRVGQYVALLGVQGQVIEIELFSTTLLHVDLSRVVVPNRKVVGEILHNYGTLRQLDLRVDVAYQSDLPEALAAIRSVLQTNRRVLQDPPPLVGVTALASSGITLAVSPWVKVPDFGPAQGEIYQALVERFRTKGVVIPFPQTEVRLLNEMHGGGQA